MSGLFSETGRRLRQAVSNAWNDPLGSAHNAADFLMFGGFCTFCGGTIDMAVKKGSTQITDTPPKDAWAIGAGITVFLIGGFMKCCLPEQPLEQPGPHVETQQSNVSDNVSDNAASQTNYQQLNT